jgi:hypothetical protein
MNLDQIRAVVERVKNYQTLTDLPVYDPVVGDYEIQERFNDAVMDSKALAKHCEELMREIEVRDKALEIASDGPGCLDCIGWTTIAVVVVYFIMKWS